MTLKHIAIKEIRKKEFEKRKIYPRESHDEIMKRILDQSKKNQEADSRE